MNYNELMAERKANHEALLASIDVQLKDLMNKRTLAKETYRAENRGITEAYHQAVVNTAEGRRKRILRHAHNLHRIFTGFLHDPNHLWGGVFDKDTTCVQFKIEEDKVVFTIEIPTINHIQK